MADLYDLDILEWSEQQAELLRRVAAGEPVNARPDWPNIIEELEAVGRSELRACESFLRQTMIHLLKIGAWPGSKAVAHWRDETRNFLFEAGQAFSPSMAPRINLDRLYGSALQQVRGMQDDADEPRPLPDTCPFTLDALLAGDLDELIAMLAKALSDD